MLALAPIVLALAQRPASVDLADATPDERLALAIDEVARGSASAGLARLEALAGDQPDPARRGRIEREIRRVRAWIELRDAYLRSLVGTEALLEFSYKQRKLKTKVLGFEGGELLLEKSRAPERLSPDAIDALELAQQVEAPGGAGEWARVYPYVLREDPRGVKLLRDDGAEAGALLADARGDYRVLLRLGAAARRLLALAARPVPATPAEIDAELAELRELLRELGDTALIARKRALLLDHARAHLARRCELVGVHKLLRGKLEPLGGESVRLTYAFDDSRELEDFEASLYPRRSAKGLQEVGAEDAPFAVADGRLTGRGRAGLRGLFDLGAPLTVRYGLSYSGDIARAAPVNYFALGLCDDGQERFLWGLNFGTLQLFDRDRFDQAVEQPLPYYPDRLYQMELRHDGERVAILCDGELQNGLGAGTRTSGAIFLRAQCEAPVWIDQLVIEGRLLEGSFARLERAWIERELAGY